MAAGSGSGRGLLVPVLKVKSGFLILTTGDVIDDVSLYFPHGHFHLYYLVDSIKDYYSHSINLSEVVQLLVGHIDGILNEDLIAVETRGFFRREGLVDIIEYYNLLYKNKLKESGFLEGYLQLFQRQYPHISAGL